MGAHSSRARRERGGVQGQPQRLHQSLQRRTLLATACKLAIEDALKQSHLAHAIATAQRLIAKIAPPTP
jgi:hypothetical protein